MKILVINGSPHGAKGNTEVLVNAFLEGAAENGAQSETIYLKDKKIEHCIGCFGCWVSTPGVCVHKDDMADLLQKVIDADVTVYASPLYVYTFTGLMKDFLDRSIPLVYPQFEVNDGITSHPGRHDRKLAVLISNCGFPETVHFTGLKETFNCCFRGGWRDNAGMICCTAGGLFHNPETQDMIAWYMDAVKQAGREVVTDRHISADTQEILNKPLVEDSELFARVVNEHWKSVMSK